MQIRPDSIAMDRNRRRRPSLGVRLHPSYLWSTILFLSLLLAPAAFAQQQEQQEEQQQEQQEEAAIGEEAEESIAADAQEAEQEVDRLEEALDDLEERLDDLEDAVDDSEIDAATADSLRDQRRDVRRARERIQRRLRSSSRDAKVAFGSSIHLEAGQVGRDLVAIGGSVHAEGDVNGDVVAIGGNAEIEGRVTGEVVAVGGRVILGPEAEVLGSVTAVGFGVERAEGSIVEGGVNEIDFGPDFTMDLFDWDWDDWDDWDSGRSSPWRMGNLFEFFMGIVWLLMIALVASLIHLVAGKSLEKIRRKAVASPWVSLLVGLLFCLFFFPILLVLVILLCITVIGMPIGCLLLLGGPLLFLIAAVTGLAAVGLAIGRWAEARFGWSLGGGLAAMLVGLVCIHALSLFGDLVSIGGGPLTFFALMFGLAGFFVKLIAWMVGLGAVVLNVINGKDDAEPEAVGLPPVPATPPAEAEAEPSEES